MAPFSGLCAIDLTAIGVTEPRNRARQQFAKLLKKSWFKLDSSSNYNDQYPNLNKRRAAAQTARCCSNDTYRDTCILDTPQHYPSGSGTTSSRPNYCTQYCKYLFTVQNTNRDLHFAAHSLICLCAMLIKFVKILVSQEPMQPGRRHVSSIQ